MLSESESSNLDAPKSLYCCYCSKWDNCDNQLLHATFSRQFDSNYRSYILNHIKSIFSSELVGLCQAINCQHSGQNTRLHARMNTTFSGSVEVQSLSSSRNLQIPYFGESINMKKREQLAYKTHRKIESILLNVMGEIILNFKRIVFSWRT